MEELGRVQTEYSSYEYMNNPFANAMYDELWTLALALNASLPDIREQSLSLTTYYTNISQITAIIKSHIQDVAFQGAVNN